MSPNIRPPKLAISLLGLTLAILILGYSNQFFQKSQLKASQKPIIQVSLCEMFPGDLKRLKPHLDLGEIACLKFDYSKQAFGNDSIDLKLQEWRNGKPMEEGISPKITDNNYKIALPWFGLIYEGTEITLSVKNTSDANDQPKYKILTVTQWEGVTSLSGPVTIDRPKRPPGTGMFTFTQYQDGAIKLERNSSIPVWALIVREDDQSRSPSDNLVQSIQKKEDISQAVKGSDWALVLNLHRVKKDNKAQK